MSDIATAQAMEGNVSTALDIALSIDDADDRGSALGEIAGLQAKVGDRQGAKLTLAAALGTVQGIEDAVSRALALNGIAAIQAQTGDRRAARDTLVAAFKAVRDNKEDNFFQAGALREIGIAQASVGDIAGAFETARSIAADDSSFRRPVFGAIAQAQAEARDFASAIKTSISIEGKGNQVRALARVGVEIANTVKASSVVEPGRLVASKRVEESLRLGRAERVLIQRGLASLKLDVGPADGVFGKRTRAALGAWQARNGIEGTGYLTQEQADSLIAEGKLLTEFCAEIPRSKLCGER